jgi:hypothetical protein
MIYTPLIKEILECYTCDTGLVSRDPLSSCFTASNVPILSCPDSSYTKCRQETSVFQIEGITYYYGKRGCGSLVSSGFVDVDVNQFDLGGIEFECDERICNNIPGKYSVPEPVNLTISESAQMLDVRYARFNTVTKTATVSLQFMLPSKKARLFLAKSTMSLKLKIASISGNRNQSNTTSTSESELEESLWLSRRMWLN